MPKVMNYTTEISAWKSVQEIESMLVDIGVTDIMKKTHPVTRQITELRFVLIIESKPVPFRLIAQVEEVAKRLSEMYNKEHSRTRKRPGDFADQAYRVSWRVWRDFVQAQIDLVLTGNAQAVQALLPYLMVNESQTAFDVLAEKGLKMLEGK